MAEREIELGDGYMSSGDYNKAIFRFSRALTLAPDNKQAREKMRRALRAKAAEENVLQ
jgi:Tfp pilus assembly protein PilF